MKFTIHIGPLSGEKIIHHAIIHSWSVVEPSEVTDPLHRHRLVVLEFDGRTFLVTWRKPQGGGCVGRVFKQRGTCTVG